ncbi:hypothetical protein [Bacillus pseudomycoides]|uniref:hypothetical protein n=1 Tax=Bacillus pseudomycoides TaxID=64104 RepID=UPI0001A19174|nr:hypothetical protein [Bacillus pseudomycoides]EEM14013.1 hypothetical protein bpmyx0001_51140 [Bacillus pseudomycoides DSM 12442]MED1599552.1 hypothetical protein [Bacillus pseudomycoides]
MAGLVVGAIGLSTWVPASQAATPEKNKYYTIHLEANSNIGDEILLFTCEKHSI